MKPASNLYIARLTPDVIQTVVFPMLLVRIDFSNTSGSSAQLRTHRHSLEHYDRELRGSLEGPILGILGLHLEPHHLASSKRVSYGRPLWSPILHKRPSSLGIHEPSLVVIKMSLRSLRQLALVLSEM